MLKQLTTFFSLLLVAVNTFAAIDSSWLLNRQNPDGSFTAVNDIATPAQNTSEVLQTLFVSGEINLIDENMALQLIDGLDSNHLENISRKISAYKNAGIDTSAQLVQLELFINADGGFGSRIGYQSTVLDTALALQTLAASGYLLDDDFAYALAYLIDRQNTDGSWSSAGNVSSVFITATVSLALQKAQAVFDVTSQIIAANVFLLDHVQANIVDIEIFEIASVVLSVAPATSDKTAYQFLLDYLLMTRDVDGSWVQDSYTTALAMRALLVAAQAPSASGNLSSVIAPGSAISAVTGVITDDLSGQVLAGATVNITLADGSNAGVITGADGRYTISNLFPGAASLSIDLAGYHTVSATPVLSAGVIHRFNPVLTRQPQPVSLNISGSVVDAGTGLPLSGISIQVVNSSVATVTSVTGDFSLNNLPAGSISIQISGTGYISHSYVISAASGGNFNLGQVALTAGSSANNLATLTGIVTDAISGRPLNGVAISLSGADNQSAFTDVNGVFTIDNVNPGDSNITAVLAGYIHAISDITFATGTNAQFNAALVKVDNQAQVTVQGSVIDNETLLPLSGVEIQLIGRSQLVQSNTNGEFQLAGITPGLLQVGISLINYQNITYNIIATKGGLVNLGKIRLSTKASTNVSVTVVSVNVPGTSDMWLAGMPNGSISDSDSAPANSPVLASGIDFSAGSLTFSNVSGGVSNSPGCLPDTGYGCSVPDGDTFFNHFPGVIYGMSNVRAPINALMGVFLDDSQPDGSPAPATLNFETIGTGFVSLSPELKQVFFIGDGLTGSGNGEAQKFVIPQGATRLYLGVMDGYGWYNNSGALNVDIVVKSGELDLAAAALNVDKVSTNLQTLQISGSAGVNIKNTGTASVESPVLVTVFEDSNANKLYDIGIDNVLGEARVFVGLAKGEAFDADIPLSGVVAFRDSAIYAMVDSDLKIAEMDEGNNVSNTLKLCPVSANVPGQTAAPLADLTASSLKVNSGASPSSSISVRIGNGGELSVTQAVNINFYEGDPDKDGVLLGTVAINSLTSGVYQDVTLDNIPALAGNKNIFVVVDADNLIAECNEFNNTVSLPVLAASSSADLLVSTDNTQYIAGSQVALQGSVSNSSAVPGKFIVQLQVEDAQGNIVHVFAPKNTGILAGQSAINVNATWDSAGVLTGNYQLRGQLYDLNNNVISSNVASFSLTSAAGQTTGQTVTALRSNTDKPLYHTTDRVRIDNLISNNSADSIITNAQLRIDIRNVSGVIVFTRTDLIPVLTAGSRLRQSIVYSFSAEAEGSYTVTAQLLTQQSIVLSTAQTSYIVKSDVAKSIVAQTSVQSAGLYIGQPQVCTDKLQNTGKLDLSALNVQQTLIDVSNNQILQTKNQTLDLTVGASQTYIRNLDTVSLAAGDYLCALQMNIDGDLRTLDFSAFKLAVPPVSAEGVLKSGSRGQLLVWFEPPYAELDHDDHSDEHDADETKNNTFELQRQYLTGLLDEDDWAYTLVDNRTDFVTAFSRGQYQAYLLLNIQEKLDQFLAKALREAVYRGEGLVMIAGNDESDSKLHDSLEETFAIKLREDTAVVDVLNFANDNTLELNGSITFEESSVVQGLEQKQAQTILQYQQAVTTSSAEHHDDDSDDHATQPAVSVYEAVVSFNQYGQGRALYAGFDVLAYAQQYPDKPLLQTLLKQALLKTHPSALSLLVSSVMPIEVSIKNTGSAAIVQSMLTVDGTASWLRATDGVLLNSVVSWQYPAQAASEQAFTAWLQLPASGGDTGLTLLTKAGLDANTLIEQNTATQTITVAIPVTLNSIISQMEDLQAQGYQQKSLKKALKKLNRALAYENEDKLRRASEKAIAATDKLKQETDPAIIEVRLKIDRWLRLVWQRSHGALFLDDDESENDD